MKFQSLGVLAVALVCVCVAYVDAGPLSRLFGGRCGGRSSRAATTQSCATGGCDTSVQYQGVSQGNTCVGGVCYPTAQSVVTPTAPIRLPVPR